ncbi:MAG: hypothetical protein J6D21_02575 [Clostridia bacterium]|nr:hypothetical protein [Clostridia bacterium]
MAKPEKTAKYSRGRATSMVPGLIVLSVILAVIVAVALLFLVRLELVQLPFLGGASTTPVETDRSFADELLSRLPAQPDGGEEGVSLEITLDDLETIVTEAASDVDHVHRMKITYTSGVRRIQYAEVVSKGGKFRADLTDSQGTVLKRILYDKVHIQVFDGATGQSKIFALNDWFSLSNAENKELLAMLYGFSPKGEIGIPSMADVLELLTTEEIADYRIELVRDEKVHYIRVSFTYTLTGVREEYDLDLETGIILSARSSLNGTVYYTAETEEISYVLTEYGDSYFKIQ